MKMRLFETQLATARAAEARQAEDNTQLRAEIARQGALMTSIRRIEDSLSAKTRSEKESLQKELGISYRKVSENRGKTRYTD